MKSLSFKFRFIVLFLAAAYAGAGDFAKAVETAQKAMDIAEAAGQKESVEMLRKRLKSYKAGQPFEKSL